MASSPSRRSSARRAAPRSCCICARTRPTPRAVTRPEHPICCRAGSCVDPAQLLRPHLAADPDAQGGVGQGQRCAEGQRRMGNGEPGKRAVDPGKDRDHRRAVQGVLSAHRARRRRAAGLHAQSGRGPQRVHPAAVRARQAPMDCSTATIATASSSTSSACSSWTTPSS